MFGYNADGQRVQKVDSTGTANFVWDGQNVLQEADQNEVTQVTYTLGPALYGNLLSQRRGTATSFYHFDGLGSTDRLTNATGTVTDTYVYQAFGSVQSSSGSTINPYLYCGKIGYTVTVNLTEMYVRERWLGVGRWITRDPLGFEGGYWNLYGYVGSNCLNLTDPSGNRVRLYVHPHPLPTDRFEDGTNIQGGHVTIVWDDKKGNFVYYDGGGVSNSAGSTAGVYGTRVGSPIPRRNGKLKTKINFDNSDWRGDILKGDYLAHHKPALDPRRFWDPDVVGSVKFRKTPEEELKDLDDAFCRLNQVPYHPKGPNSNTYAHQLLWLAGFVAQPRYSEVRSVSGIFGGGRHESWDKKDAKEEPEYEGKKKISNSETRWWRVVGPVGSVGWNDETYGGREYDKYGNKR
jgi:RHS repeat-associated protein